jgi:hypothetical protein
VTSPFSFTFKTLSLVHVPPHCLGGRIAAYTVIVSEKIPERICFGEDICSGVAPDASNTCGAAEAAIGLRPSIKRSGGR